MVTENSLKNVFNKLYFKDISQGDEFIGSLWNRISSGTTHMLSTIGLSDCEPVLFIIGDVDSLVEKLGY